MGGGGGCAGVGRGGGVGNFTGPVGFPWITQKW